MEILVLGAGGMAGHTVAHFLKEQHHRVTAFARTKLKGLYTVTGNALDREELGYLILEGNYDAVINCIGILNHHAEENHSESVYVNSYLPHWLVSILKNTPTKLIHMSTDCVFAGNTGPYYEDSFRDGPTFYDRTKALGEVDDGKNLTFRTSIIGPGMNPNGTGLFNRFMKQTAEASASRSATWTGITTLTLAKATEWAIRENLTGIYNLVNNDNISKYELLKLFNKYFRDGKLTIKPDDNLQLSRTLVCGRKDDFSFTVPSYEQMIVEMKEWVSAHIDLYPSYF